MLCPNCEAENREGARFCDECGFPLAGTMARGGAVSPAESVEPADGLATATGERLDASAYEQEPAFEPFSEPIGFDFEDFPAYDYAGTETPPNPIAEQVEQAADQHVSDQKTMAFDELAPQGEEADPGATPTAREQNDDPFAGYSQSIDEQEYGFRRVGAPDQEPADDATEKPEFTMEMPRVERQAASAPRDFRISGESNGGPKSRIGAVVAGGVIAGIVIAALVTYLLGFWGGIAVPDVTGMTESDARTALEEEGFSVRSTQVKSDDTEGLVLVMDPAGGSRAGEGSEVVIHISTARFVPDVMGKSEAEARSLLTDSGYENVRYEKEKSEGEEGIVLSITPEAGTRVKSNAEIVVSVSEAYRVPDISGLDLDAAAQAIVGSGLAYGVTYVDTDQYEDGTILGTDPEAGTQVEKDSYVSINVTRRRGAELVALTQAMLAQGQTVTIGGVDYEIESVDSVVFAGNDVVSFTVTGLPKTTFFGKTIYADEQVVNGQVVWSEDNEVISIS